MARQRIPYDCTCGSIGKCIGGNRRKDGTLMRRVKCQDCGRAWQVTVTQPMDKTPGRRNGLWMHWRGYWYSPGEQARIRESARMGSLL